MLALTLMRRREVPVRARQEGISSGELQRQLLEGRNGIVPFAASELAESSAKEFVVRLVSVELEIRPARGGKPKEQTRRSASPESLVHMGMLPGRRASVRAHASLSSFLRRASMLR